jgi:hypothetical protein
MLKTVVVTRQLGKHQVVVSGVFDLNPAEVVKGTMEEHHDRLLDKARDHVHAFKKKFVEFHNAQWMATIIHGNDEIMKIVEVI